MPPPVTLKIHEIFPSVQGEGLRIGLPTLFVRLSGCNLRCSFCDTKEAWSEGIEMGIEDITDVVSRLKKDWETSWVCLTGGEPLFQEISPLASRLKKAGYSIQVETNATRFQNLEVDWYTISPKPDNYDYCPQYRDLAKEIKLVVNRQLTLQVIRRVRDDFSSAIPVFLQPQSNEDKSALRAMDLVRKAGQEGLENIRIGVQLHKVFGFR